VTASAGAPTRWATPAAVKAAVATKWDSGALLRELHTEPGARTAFPLKVRLPGPTREELPTLFAQASAWVQNLKDAAAREGWELVSKPMRAGGLGTQQVPASAIVPTPEVGLALLGRAHAADAARFAVALQRATALDGAAAQLALSRPHDVLDAGEDWPLLLALADWIRRHPRPGIFIRQIPVAGVHTKVLERHTGLLTRLLNVLLPVEAVDADMRTFTARFGFAAEPRRVRLRGAAAVLGVPATGFTDTEWEVASLAALDPHAHGIAELLVLENKTSFLTVTAQRGRLIVWGAGYGADELLAALPWRDQVAIRYWGDIDTHGLAILARVRAVAPQTTSVLMDTATLLAHRPYWGSEKTPHTGELRTLTDAEADLLTALRTAEYGDRVRLEQEFIRFDLVEAALAAR